MTTTRNAQIFIPAIIEWSMTAEERARDILQTLFRVEVEIGSEAKARRVIAAAIEADRNTATVDVSRQCLTP